MRKECTEPDLDGLVESGVVAGCHPTLDESCPRSRISQSKIEGLPAHIVPVTARPDQWNI